MEDAFFSYAKEDSEVAGQLATKLRSAGFTAWCYKENQDREVWSYLSGIVKAIAACRAFVLLISHRSLRSPEVRKEVIQAHKRRKPIIPILVDLSHDEFEERCPEEWSLAIAEAVSISLQKRGMDTAARIVVTRLRDISVSTAERVAAPQALTSSSDSELGTQRAEKRAAMRLNVDWEDWQILPLETRSRLMRVSRAKAANVILATSAFVVAIGPIFAAASRYEWLVGVGSLVTNLTGVGLCLLAFLQGDIIAVPNLKVQYKVYRLFGHILVFMSGLCAAILGFGLGSFWAALLVSTGHGSLGP